ncbi:Copper chaperone [Bacteroidales bacterium Barb6XT]|nr:Copper chaperone [Bacteroidales bacterium Barb6XT]
MRKLVLMFAATVCLAANSASAEEAQDSLKVEGSCGMCKKRIEKTAAAVEGVTAAVWDQKTKSLRFDYDADKTTPEAVSKALAKSGHDTCKDKADDTTYEALPGCCQYRK